MQVEVDEICMSTKFGGRDLSGFGGFAPICFPSEMAKFPFQTMDYSPRGQKIELAEIFHAS